MADEEPCGSEEKQDFLPGFANVNEYTQQTLRAVLGATKCSNELPGAGDDFDYYSSFPGFQDIMEVERKRILQVMQALMKHQNVKINLGSVGGASDIEDKMDLLMDANDQILERVGTWLDEASGLKKKDNTLVVATATPKLTSTASWNKKNLTSSTSSPPSYKLLTARNILRPQIKFKEKVDNSSRPFCPILREKPNQIKSLEESLQLPEGIDADAVDSPDFQYPHPYKSELDHLKYAPGQLARTEPQKPLELEATQLTFVDTKAGLTDLVTVLKAQKEFAVDLEHHSYRTYQGITCLIQISTRKQDYIVDSLELRSDLHCLNEVFTDPHIVKVFHGADMDIDWLQRDCGVYVVNMFDTGQAARVMNFSRFSLAHLLQYYCNVTADKQYQLADWRIRPLPEALVKYAREDTHNLLYIYDMMKNELFERGNMQNNLFLSVLHRSKEVCLRVYRKPVYREDDHLELYRKNKKVFNSQQMQALQNLYAWRDELARAEDESIGYVLPNHMLLQICGILPRENQGVLACCNPIPPLVRQYLNEIHAIIMKARDAPLHKLPTLRAEKPSGVEHPKYDVDSLLNCPHDLSNQAQDLTSRPTLLDESLVSSKSSVFPEMKVTVAVTTMKEKPILSVFAYKESKISLTPSQRLAAEISSQFVSPFDQFLPSTENKTVAPESLKRYKVLPQTEKVTWKLVPNTKKRKEQPTEDSEVQPAKRSRVSLESESEPGEIPAAKTSDDKKALPQDLEIPLRFEMPAKKKKKKNKNRDIEVIESVERHDDELDRLRQLNAALGSRLTEQAGSSKAADGPSRTEGRHKKKQKHAEDEEEEFTPYDYNKGQKLLHSKTGQKMDYYDPMSQMRGKKGKGFKAKGGRERGKKSATWKT